MDLHARSRFHNYALGFLVLFTASEAASLLGWRVCSQAQAFSFRTVALSEQPAPGDPNGNGYDRLADFSPVINRAGQVAFHGAFASTGSWALWSEGSGSLSLVEDLGTDLSVEDYSLVLTNDGQAAYRFTQGITNSTVATVRFEQNNQPQFVARSRDPIPGPATGPLFDAGISSLVQPRVNARGQLFFAESYGSGSGVFLYEDNQLRQVISNDQPPPGVDDGSRFRQTPSNIFRARSIDETGRYYFQSFLDEPARFAERFYFGVGDADGIERIEISLDQLGGQENATVLLELSELNANNSGTISFRAKLAGPFIDASNDGGYWVGQPGGEYRKVVREAEPAPGTEDGVTFFALGINEAWLDSAGDMAFRSFLAGPGVDPTNDFGVWYERGGEIQLLARDGDQAAGVESGLTYDVFRTRPSINGNRQAAFLARLRGPGVTFDNNEAMWVTQPDGQIELLLRKGDLFDVDDDPLAEDLRRISSVRMRGGTTDEGGLGSSFNNAGQLVFSLGFDDGTEGIFVANTFVVPEPSGIALLIVGAIPGWCCRRSAVRREH